MEMKYNTAYKHKNIKVVEMEGIRWNISMEWD
jgi:hypothetical protein